MNNVYYKQSNSLKLSIKNYLSKNKSFIILMVIIIIVALLTGIFTGIKCSGEISISNCNDNTLVKFFKRDISVVSFFVKRVFYYLFILLVMFLICRFKISIPIFLCYIAYLAFSLGLNSVVIVLVFGFGGAINVCLVVFPVKLSILIVMSLVCIFAIRDCLTINAYGRLVGCGNSFVRWLMFYGVIFLICVIETVFINLTCSSFIFII